MIYYGLLFLFLLSALILAGVHFSNKIIYPKTLAYEETYIMEQEKGKLDSKWFESLPKENVTIMSEYGYKLNGKFFPVQGSKKAVIICHGITHSLYGSVKYMEIFYKRGFNVLIYDHRNHGKSEGSNTTFGYFEKFDLMSCTDWVLNRCGFDCKIGILGESMGASIALQNSVIDPRVSFYISDCAFSDLKEQLKYRLKVQYRLPAFPLLFAANIITRVKAGFYLGQVSPIKDLEKVKTPIFFIHGAEDRYVRPYMSEDLYNAKKGAKKLYISPDARHAESCWVNKEEYDRLVGEFLMGIKF